MRVVAGRYRGRKLAVPSGSRMRPTTDRVREAMFSMLGDRIIEVEGLDLCCGSGALGIEALSRGASMVHFVDIDGAALKAVRKNLDICSVPPEQYLLHRSDALAWLRRWRKWRRQAGLVVLADPPYGFGLAGGILQTLVELPPEAGLRVGLVEHESSLDMTWPDRVTRRDYGRSSVSVVEVHDDS